MDKKEKLEKLTFELHSKQSQLQEYMDTFVLRPEINELIEDIEAIEKEIIELKAED